MRDPTESEKRDGYDRWGPVCVICGAPPRDVKFAEEQRGVKDYRIPLHHGNGDRSINETWNLIPLCDRIDASADGCHPKVHNGNGGPIHNVLSRRLLGAVSRSALVTVLEWVSEECPKPSSTEKRRVAEVLVTYGQSLAPSERQQLQESPVSLTH